MAHLLDFITQRQWLVFHEKDNPHSVTDQGLSALAYQDSFIRYLPDYIKDIGKNTGILHFYPYDYPNVLLGGKDTRLANLTNGLNYLANQGYAQYLRPHGGLAVINDIGVTNVSLVIDSPNQPVNIDTAYEIMVALIRVVTKKYGLMIESYEIPDSYCPGKYDLVCQGLKIGGIAQRRFKDAFAVAAYISVDGNQKQRADIIANFYKQAEATSAYPKVRAESMSTLSDLMGVVLTRRAFEIDLINHFQQLTRIKTGNYDDLHLESIYNQQIERAKKRNQKIELTT